MPLFLKILILIYMAVAFNPDIRAHSMLWYSVTIATSLSMFLYLLILSRLKLNRYVWWLIIFNLWGLSSIFWALNQEYVFTFAKTSLALMIILIPMSLLIRTREDIWAILKIVVLAAVTTSIYLLFNIDRSVIGEIEFGVRTAGEGWNANAIGLMTSIAVLACVAIIKQGVSKSRLIFYTSAIVLFGYISLFTGSRKTLFILMAGIASYFLLTSKNNKVVVLSGISGFIFVFYYLIISVPELYNVLGIRVEGLLAQITGTGSIDSSTLIRMQMIDYGINWFKQNPLIGYGMNNYRTLLSGATGTSTYAHNNYIELLVDVGIIGTAIYYYIYIYIIKHLFKTARKKETIASLFFVLIILLMVIEYGFVSYYDNLMQLIICLGYAATQVFKEKNMV